MNANITVTDDGVELIEEDQYDRSAKAKVTLDGPDGEIVLVRKYRAMTEPDNGIMDPGQIKGYTAVYVPGTQSYEQNQPLTDTTVTWDVPEAVIEDPDRFVEECRAGHEADFVVDYEEFAKELPDHVESAE